MGMVLNRFSTLKKLRDDKYYQQQYQFKLVGVIVHQKEDRHLQNAIQENFFDWAHMTGEEFLFITFIRGGRSRLRHELARDKYVLTPKQLMIDDDTPFQSQEQTLEMLREYFGLSNDASYLMLAENLQSRHFSKVRITADSIEWQLHLITSYCLSGDDSPSSYLRLIHRLNGEDVEGHQPLSDSLLDVIALTARTDRYYCFNREDQEEWIQKWYQREYQRIQASSEEDSQAKHFVLSTRLAMGLENLKDRDLPRHEVRDDFFEIAPSCRPSYSEDLEQETQGSFDSEEILHKCKEIHFDYIPAPRHRDPLDNLDTRSRDAYRTLKTLESVIPYNAESWFNYSSLTVCINQIIETELHLSVCQMMRYAMGIPMPKYFNLYSGEHGRVDIETGNAVAHLNHFNQEENGVRLHQKSVPLGTLYHAYMAMIYQDVYVNYPERLDQLNDSLLCFWHDYFHRCRNQSAHTIDPESRSTYRLAKRYFEEFLNDYSSTLADIRKRMSGRA